MYMYMYMYMYISLIFIHIHVFILVKVRAWDSEVGDAKLEAACVNDFWKAVESQSDPVARARVVLGIDGLQPRQSIVRTTVLSFEYAKIELLVGSIGSGSLTFGEQATSEELF